MYMYIVVFLAIRFLKFGDKATSHADFFYVIHFSSICIELNCSPFVGAQWLSGRGLDWRPRSCGFEPRWHHCVVSLSKNINHSLVLVQPRKTHPFITERVLMECKEPNQTKKTPQFALFVLTCSIPVISVYFLLD